MSNYNELRLTYQGGQQTAITLTSNIINSNEYQRQDIVAVEVPEIVTGIGEYAFCDNNFLSSITLNEGLQTINGQAFQHGTYSAITIPSTVTYIGMNAFNIRDEQDMGSAGNLTITCLAATPPTLVDNEGITFGDPSKITAIYVPSGSASVYKASWPRYASLITEGEPETGCTNLTMSAAYVGLEPAQKIYLGNNLVWEPAPDPCEGLTGKALCDCEGGYWWNGECHDYVDPMFWEPLTIAIENPGTGTTTGLMWRLSGVSRSAEVTQYGRSIVYSKNDGPLTVVQMTGTPTTSKTVDVVIATGLSQGDVFRFYGASSAVGAYGFASGGTGGVLDGPFHYFVNYSGMQAKVYGNIKSLLTDKATWDDRAQRHDKQAIDNLPMDDRAFMNLFQGKTAFTFNEDATYHLVLPDCNLSTYCFKGLFNGCTRMTTAPELPATALTNSCYREMFYGCTSLTSAPALPAETLAANCYRSMFNGCTSLTAATTLPALSVPDSAYLSMFANCPITQAPALPATTLAPYCYSNMFRGTNITDMPELPATTLAANCYESMFSACTRLTTAPELPATTLANYCYQNMFQGCTSLTTAPELPATTLGDACYYHMFRDCTNLTTAPALPATTLVSYCYNNMFRGCQNLNYIKCLATNISAGYCTTNWVYGVSSTGTFVKNASMSNWTTGTNGIPTGWTVQDYVEPNNS